LFSKSLLVTIVELYICGTGVVPVV
jgi:hypothetical protein